MYQHRMLYVFDPVAMHNIVVKDQYIYEETSMFITYVLDTYALAKQFVYFPEGAML